MYCGCQYNNGLNTSYFMFMKLDSQTNWTIGRLASGYPTAMKDMKYFNGRYFGYSDLSQNEAYSFTLDSGSAIPRNIVKFNANSNNTIKTNMNSLNGDPVKFFIYNNAIYYLSFMNTSSTQNSVNIYKSTDGITFTLFNSSTFEGKNYSGAAASTNVVYYCGEDNENLYFILYYSITAGNNLRPVVISKKDGSVTLKPYFNAHANSLLVWGLSK